MSTAEMNVPETPPINLLLIIAMVSLGIVFGAIPGLSATLGIALLLPVTFGLSTETSFVLLLAIWIGGVSGTFIRSEERRVGKECTG